MSVWMRPPKRKREQPSLSREQIVSQAIELLDGGGVDALSMRKLGARLGVAAPSMYTHVATKDELVELVVDEVYGEVALPGEGPWRVVAGRFARDLRSVFLRHPWLGSLLGETGVAYLGPNVLKMSEAALALFENAGFSLEDADLAWNTVMAFVVGRATSEAAWLTTLERGGQSEAEWKERLWPAAEQAVRDHPRLKKLYAAQRRRAPGETNEADFERGLDCVFDGLETRLP
ncbi:TetR family transcriptional regulator [Amycolatopsis sp. WAC 04169]|uniref:TetR/AcrR family transcriptional regulator C-terminal domain-containing protein n=1 Tax=Amycolatopsis sp. WAC 04169 TaxID=2203197 RepID=UPI000F788174|nr:TetR/AcrR family transcriptional regulator C-terminal domain-containing protein [Amycolatopsis sp. WAC 04169]RSN32405.1 TetR family transcriptional regulator [Amycolatopsis sp. WAC 04169]